MKDILIFLDEFTLGLEILALTLYVLFTRKKVAFSIILSGVCLLGAFHQWLVGHYLKLFDAPSYAAYLQHTWYLGFAITDMIAVVSLIYICKRNYLPLDKASKFILQSYLLLAGIQITRYIDRLVLGTDLLAAAYKLAIPVLNFGIASVAIFVVLNTILYLLINKIKKYRLG